MRTRKKGYPLLLAVTVTWTLLGLLGAVLPEGVVSLLDAGANTRMVFVLVSMAGAGTTCVIRKRFFTEE